MLKYRRVIPNPTRTIMWLGNPMRTCLPMQNLGLWEYENSNRSYWIEYNSCFPLLSIAFPHIWHSRVRTPSAPHEK